MIERLLTLDDKAISQLADLLIDAVNDGASVGYLAPLDASSAVAYWQGVLPDVEASTRVLLVARIEGRIVGSVQLELPQKPNATHRAEVQKLLVHTAARCRGLGGELMVAVERQAVELARYLLVLDTRTGDTASRLYERLGYILAGVIPGYARSSSGRLDGTSFYYKDLS